MTAVEVASTGPAWQQIGLGVLSRTVPAELIDRAVSTAGVTQRRLRLLPSRLVVLFVLALTLFSPEGYRQVWRSLTCGWPRLARITPTTSALSQARRRLGEAPLRLLFEQTRGVQGGPDSPGVFVAGRRLAAWDGTKLHLPDSDANAAAFGRDRGGGGTEAGYPQLRLLTLIECGTHAIIAAAFGRDAEQVLARSLVPHLTPDMLLIVDRNFFGYDLWTAAAATGAALAWRVKANRLLPVIQPLPDGSWISIIKPPPHRRGDPPIPVRVAEYQITVTTTDPHGATRQRTERFRLVTNLLDPTEITAAELADCYQQRWESETGYQDLKTRQRGPKTVLRSRDPVLVRQEVWAYLITHQALRELITHTATQTRLDPDRLSFTTCLRAVRRHLITGTGLTNAIQAITDELLDDQLHPRRPRTAPRAVKRPTAAYRAKKRTEPATTTATYDIALLTGQESP